MNLADALERRYYSDGQCVIKQVSMMSSSFLELGQVAFVVRLNYFTLGHNKCVPSSKVS